MDENSVLTALNVRTRLSLVTSSVMLQTTKPILCLFILDKLLHLRGKGFFCIAFYYNDSLCSRNWLHLREAFKESLM